MKNINKLRNKIDLIDNQILTLLKNRSKLAIKIGEVKKHSKTKNDLYRPERQAEILRRLFSKKSNLFKEVDILNLWRQIFTHQISLQGKINFIIPKNLNKIEERTIINSFGNNIQFNIVDNLKEGFDITKKKNNFIFILPFPNKSLRSKWWINKACSNLYIVDSIPQLREINSIPQLVLISKHSPNIKGSYTYVYKSLSCEKNKNMIKVVELNKNNLYISQKLYKNDEYIFLGAYPNLVSKN